MVTQIMIPELPVVASAELADILVGSRAGSAKQLTLQQICDLFLATLTAAAPEVLDTWLELVAQIEDNEDGLAALVTAVAGKAPLASPALTGIPTAPTALAGNNTTQLATTAFVQGAVEKVAFGAIKAGDQTGFGTSPIKVTFSTEVKDTGGFYDVGNSRFTPLVAGTYYIAAGAFLGAPVADGLLYQLFVYKNGAFYRGVAVRGSGVSGFTLNVECLVDLNGTSDYIEVFHQSGASGGVILGTAGYAYFEGNKI